MASPRSARREAPPVCYDPTDILVDKLNERIRLPTLVTNQPKRIAEIAAVANEQPVWLLTDAHRLYANPLRTGLVQLWYLNGLCYA